MNATRSLADWDERAKDFSSVYVESHRLANANLMRTIEIQPVCISYLLSGSELGWVIKIRAIRAREVRRRRMDLAPSLAGDTSRESSDRAERHERVKIELCFVDVCQTFARGSFFRRRVGRCAVYKIT